VGVIALGFGVIGVIVDSNAKWIQEDACADIWFSERVDVAPAGEVFIFMAIAFSSKGGMQG